MTNENEEYTGKVAQTLLLEALKEEEEKRQMIITEALQANAPNLTELKENFSLADKITVLLKELDIEDLMSDTGDILLKSHQVGVSGILALIVRSISDPTLLHYLIVASQDAINALMLERMTANRLTKPKNESVSEAINGKGEAIIAEFDKAVKEGKVH